METGAQDSMQLCQRDVSAFMRALHVVPSRYGGGFLFKERALLDRRFMEMFRDTLKARLIKPRCSQTVLAELIPSVDLRAALSSPPRTIMIGKWRGAAEGRFIRLGRIRSPCLGTFGRSGHAQA